MGIQILNKDVSVISGVMGKAKASIGNIFGKTGWAGGGAIAPIASFDAYNGLESDTPVDWILYTFRPIFTDSNGGAAEFWLYSTSTNTPTTYTWEFIAGTDSATGWSLNIKTPYLGTPGSTPYPSYSPLNGGTWSTTNYQVASGATYTMGTASSIVFHYISNSFMFGTPHNAQVKLTVTNSAGSSSSTVICQYG